MGTQTAHSPSPWPDITAEVAASYAALRKLPDGRMIGLHRLLLHWTIHVGIDDVGHEDRWCFLDFFDALDALVSWDGEGDMCGPWHKHPKSGRRRHPQLGLEWHESELDPPAVQAWRKQHGLALP